jgi:hypothetical protein
MATENAVNLAQKNQPRAASDSISAMAFLRPEGAPVVVAKEAAKLGILVAGQPVQRALDPPPQN